MLTVTGDRSTITRTSMTDTGRRARMRAVIKLLCEQFPQAFSRRVPRPLKVGIYADALAAFGGTVEARDLKSALRAYTSDVRYLRTLSAGADRVGLDGSPAGTVTPEDEAVAKTRLADLAKVSAAGTVEAKIAPRAEPQSKAAVERAVKKENTTAASGPKRLSLADLREAGRRRRERET